ncbi:Polyphosphate glucokinase [Austwickia chelonae]|nr:ROK family protein [Austwickia chelonae]SEW06657.1 Polyphosphate glucokinase [Austwickia chelonae]
MVRLTHPLGIDIGGSGVKGAPVELETGALTTERLRIDTPRPATPHAVAEVVAQVAASFESQTGDSPVGITIPGIVRRGVMYSAANIDKSWIGVDVEHLFSERLGRPVCVLNDADAAGVAEMHYGAAKDVPGTVFLATLGTGIGTALMVDGVLVPNTELGHLEIDGHDAESRASAAVRDREDLDWPEWSGRLQRYFSHIEMLLSPDLIVVGGGVSRRADKFLPLLELAAPVIPAALRNSAGIVGAAWFATQRSRSAV